jgi:hypothetical protein
MNICCGGGGSVSIDEIRKFLHRIAARSHDQIRDWREMLSPHEL